MLLEVIPPLIAGLVSVLLPLRSLLVSLLYRPHFSLLGLAHADHTEATIRAAGKLPIAAAIRAICLGDFASIIVGIGIVPSILEHALFCTLLR